MAIQITVFYPNTEGAKFDSDYYLNVHMPLSIEKQGEKLKEVTIQIGTSGVPEGTKPPYLAICNLVYESLKDFKTAFFPHAALLQADMANYTNIETIIQVSEFIPMKKS